MLPLRRESIRGPGAIAVLLGGMLSILFAWWAWKQGAFFGPVFYPGALGVFALLGLLLAFAPFDVWISGWARVALLALVGLAAWALLSAVWSPVPSAALRYGEHAFLYAALFATGLWISHLLGSRMMSAMTPLAIASGAVAIGVVVVLATGADVTWYLHEDATLRFPIGYRNANAAFFMVCAWPTLMLATEADWRWEIRALLVATGTALLELTLLAQSRGSAPALALALLVFLVLAPHRLRAATVLALAALPVLPAIPTLLDVYHYGNADPGIVPLLRDAARAIGLSAGFSLLLAAVALRGVAPRLRLEERTVRLISRAAATVALLAVLVAGSVFVSRHGGPIGFVDQRISQFEQVGYPDLHGQGIRFGANVGSNRHDFWRVAIRQGLDHPLLGGGAGSFEISYLEHRRSGESPKDPHSSEMLMLSELGFPGLALLAAFVVGAALAGLRSRRLGPAAAGLVAGALAAGTQWLVHGSFDWFWNYPGVTAPAVFVLGAAAAPALLDLGAGAVRRLRMLGIATLAALALLTAPLYLASRYLQRGYDESGANPAAAIDDLDRAASLDPLDAEPLLVEGRIESALGDRRAALEAFREAAEREPDGYAAHYFIARELAGVDPVAARENLRRALDLNPRDPLLKALQRRLEP